MKNRMIIFLLSITIVASTILIIQNPKKTQSTTSHVVLSEIQVRSVENANDEFVELYNPTNSPVDLSSWKLSRKTASGTESVLVASLSGSIPAKGFFLIASPESSTASLADQTYSTDQRIAANNAILLYNQEGTIVDMVGLGTASASETATIGNPVNGGSVERKANASSTSESMNIGGTDEFLGNGWDTDNNSLDFIQRRVSQPQNASFPPEPPIISPTPTPSSSPTLLPTLTPTTTPNPTPTSSPTPTMTPTNTPTPIPTQTPLPTQIVTPTISPTTHPTHIPQPTPSMFPTPTPPLWRMSHITIQCSMTQKIIDTPLWTIRISIPSCRVIRL